MFTRKHNGRSSKLGASCPRHLWWNKLSNHRLKTVANIYPTFHIFCKTKHPKENPHASKIRRCSFTFWKFWTFRVISSRMILLKGYIIWKKSTGLLTPERLGMHSLQLVVKENHAACGVPKFHTNPHGAQGPQHKTHIQIETYKHMYNVEYLNIKIYQNKMLYMWKQL